MLRKIPTYHKLTERERERERGEREGGGGKSILYFVLV